ncbi:MAG: aminotransferase class I/II-fold pyridoxal phosphate-dependent enzyme [Thermaerobacterales bacterium]
MSSRSSEYPFPLPDNTVKALELWGGLGGPGGGQGVINLGSGDPAFITPDHIRQAAKDAIDAGKTHYERNQDLKDAIAAKLQRENGVHVDPVHGVVVTAGAHHALDTVFRAYVGPGDEVLMGNPGSYYYKNTIANGGVAVEIPLRKERGFRLDPAEVAARITDRTRIIALTTPEAPAAAVQTKSDLEAIADLAVRHDLLVIADEIYEAIFFADEPHASIGSFPGMGGRTITVNALSKAWAMTGWRVGYAAGEATVMRPVQAVNGLSSITITSIAQFAGLAALTGPQDFLAEALQVYRRRRDILVDGIRTIDGLDCLVPEGTYYCWVNMKHLGLSSAEFQAFCARETGVSFNPGTTFGTEGEGYIRLSCSPKEADITEGLNRLETAVRKLRS